MSATLVALIGQKSGILNVVNKINPQQSYTLLRPLKVMGLERYNFV